MREVIVHREPRKYVSRLPNPYRQRILDGIVGLKEVPPKGDIKPIVDKKGVYRLKVTSYRIIFEIDADDENVIYVTRVASRGQVYKVRR
ncbi:MAG: type II toxin-antitoxin system RelE/ParE family toxin [Bifidobacteriaceae bacterium]|jgi:mRNA interferase RelE/StbE|nr:type II toxin-antitoxin system RelE/ParE family toxin [Bifidobacteriaceae bacterium]